MPKTSKNTISEERKQIIKQMINDYDIHTVQDIQDALKDLLGDTIQAIMQEELELQLDENKEIDADYKNSKNGYKPKTLRSTIGEIPIKVPQDRNSDYEPMIVPKYKKDISEIEGKIISMYSRGLSVKQISDQIEEIYGFEVSEGMVTGITNKLLPYIEEWQKRPLESVYPIIFIDAIVFNVRIEGVTQKRAVYVVLGINEAGRKEVLSITMGENESSKFWLSVLNGLKNRGVEDIFIICADGLAGIKEAISAAYPLAEYQRCIVHMVRNTLNYVAHKDKKEFANDLKGIYHADDEKSAHEKMLEVFEKWDKKYKGSMQRWEDNWDVIIPIFKFSDQVRKTIYTTNAIESLNSSYRKINKGRVVFPNEMSLLKALYLTTYQLTKKWTSPVRNWGVVRAEFSVMYPGRLPGSN